MSYTIRKAEKQDLEAILGLVHELAVYEKAAEEVTATAKQYLQNFEEGIFEAMVAEHEGKIIGMVLYFLGFSTWKGKMLFLEDFVVTERYRRKGVGIRLFEALQEEAKQLKVQRMKWQVLDWNTPAIDFYKKYKAEFDEGWINCNLYFDRRE